MPGLQEEESKKAWRKYKASLLKSPDSSPQSAPTPKSLTAPKSTPTPKSGPKSAPTSPPTLVPIPKSGPKSTPAFQSPPSSVNTPKSGSKIRGRGSGESLCFGGAPYIFQMKYLVNMSGKVELMET